MKVCSTSLRSSLPANDHRWLARPPEVQRPDCFNSTTVGPADQRPLPSVGSELDGSEITGPTPQMAPDFLRPSEGFVGEKKPESSTSPTPDVASPPGKSTGWPTTGGAMGATRVHSLPIANGTTGWKFMTKRVPPSGPTPCSQLNCSGTLTMSASGLESRCASCCALGSAGDGNAGVVSATPCPRAGSAASNAVTRTSAASVWSCGGEVASEQAADSGRWRAVMANPSFERWQWCACARSRRADCPPCATGEKASDAARSRGQDSQVELLTRKC